MVRNCHSLLQPAAMRPIPQPAPSATLWALRPAGVPTRAGMSLQVLQPHHCLRLQAACDPDVWLPPLPAAAPLCCLPVPF